MRHSRNCSVFLIFLGGLIFLGACAPLPESSAEPFAQPLQHSHSDSADSSSSVPPEFDRSKPLSLPPPPSAATSLDSVQAPPQKTSPISREDSILAEPLPEFNDSVSTDTTANVQDSNSDSVHIAHAGSFKRESTPLDFRRALRVGLKNQISQITIQCTGLCRIFTAKGQSGNIAGNILIKASPDALLIGTADGKRARIQEDKIRIERSNPLKGILRVAGAGYRGHIEILLRQGRLTVVNIVPVELYLRGVVPKEIGQLDTTMFEALKAQAVAARTYAYRHFKSRSSLGFDVWDDQRDQVYEGYDAESELASQAIASTDGVVMQHEDKLVEAYYHSTCGGHTTDLSAWNRSNLPYLTATQDLDAQGKPWCTLSSYSTWQYEYTWKQLNLICNKYIQTAQPDPVFDFQEILRIDILDTLAGGRVGRVLYTTNRGSFVVKGDKNRWALRQPQAPEKPLPSAWFSISQNTHGIRVTGKGFGHGIGMCQMGVRAKAKAGWDYKSILWSYYPSVDLVKWIP